ncbi:MAG TPA: D-alanyl-D-alanine carboxypeptidase/D-alanyl-D-alanine-endopeptidase [Candidatus Baltobacteraceae bacterium]
MTIIANSKRRSKPSPARRLAAFALAAAMLAGAGLPSRADALHATLHATLERAFAPALARADDWSLVVLDADGKTLFADRADRALTPASTLKLVVASAALARLGPDYRFRTILAARDPLASDGTLQGDLWLAGSGDPSLVREDLRGAAGLLYANGLRRIAGGVVVDANAVAPPELNPFWNPADANEGFQSPTSGISLDQDTVEFHVIGGAPGSLARISFVPQSSAVSYAGAVVTGGADEAPDISIDATGVPNVFRVSGRVPAGDEEKIWVPVHGIAHYAGSVFERMLLDRGIAVGAPVRTGVTPLDTRLLWSHASAPLRRLVAFMLVHSDNHFAEQLMRRLGAIDGRATDADGLAAERAFLRERGIPTPGLHIVDGSGLAHADRAAAITFARILVDARRRGGGQSLLPLLPLGGEQGTLKDYRFTTALGRVRAKSGHLDGVDSLAGYVATRHRGRVAFAFVIDGVSRRADDAIVQAVDALAAM